METKTTTKTKDTTQYNKVTTNVIEDDLIIKENGVIKSFVFAFFLDTFLWSYTFLALYKIIYIKLFLNIRYPDFFWTQPLYALLAGICVTSVLFIFPSCSIGKVVMGRDKRKDSSNGILSKPYIIFTIFIILLTFVVGIIVSKVSISEFLSEGGITGAKRIFAALLTPNWAIFNEAMFAAVETIYMAFIATAFAIPIAFTMSFFAARNLMKSNAFTMAIYNFTRFLLNITRAIEPLVWAIIFSVWVGIGPFAGMMALCLHSVASLSKLYSEQIENINDGPIEAMTATGAHPIQIIWFGVVPQVVLPFLSFTIYRWDINVRMATVIGLVGGGGIGTMLMQYQGLAKWHEVGLLVLVIAIIVWLMDYSSARIREAIK